MCIVVYVHVCVCVRAMCVCVHVILSQYIICCIYLQSFINKLTLIIIVFHNNYYSYTNFIVDLMTVLKVVKQFSWIFTVWHVT